MRILYGVIGLVAFAFAFSLAVYRWQVAVPLLAAVAVFVWAMRQYGDGA